MNRSLSAGFALLLALAFLAFWPRYLSKPFGTIDAYTHLHASTAVAWFGLLIAQPLLVEARAFAAHRVLGRVSYALAPAVVVTAILLAHSRFRMMDDRTFAKEAFFLYLPLSVSLLFLVAWLAGVAWRRRRAAHARFMAVTGLTLLDPVLARIIGFYLAPDADENIFQVVTYAITDLLFLALVATMPRQSPGRAALVALLCAFVAIHAGWFVLAQTAGWTTFADAFRKLPLP